MDLCLYFRVLYVHVYGKFEYMCAVCVLCVHMRVPMCNCIPMCGVHICNICMCVYTCEKWGIALSSNCSDLSMTRQMASASGVNLEPTLGWVCVSEPGLDAALRKPLPGHLAMSGTAPLSSECLCCNHHSSETRSACVPISWWPLAPGLQCPPGSA